MYFIFQCINTHKKHLESLRLSPRLHLFNKKIKSNIKLINFNYCITLNFTTLLLFTYMNIYIFFKVIVLWWQSWVFSIVTVTWSFRNHSNMLIWCSRNIYYNPSWKLLHCVFQFCGHLDNSFQVCLKVHLKQLFCSLGERLLNNPKPLNRIYIIFWIIYY